MPGCAGYYNNPIEEWIRQGYTCRECAWERMCKDCYEANNPSAPRPYNHRPEDEIQIETMTPESSFSA